MQEYQVCVHDDRTVWYQNGQLHRENGPAIEMTNGANWWYQNGLLHREDGPAIEFADGTRAWYQNGQRHRTDGPALKRADGSVEYWIDGNKFTYNEFIVRTQPAKELTVAEIEQLLGYAVKVIK